MICRPAAWGRPGSDRRAGSAPPDPADDGYRNATEFLRARLRISAAEARRRISLAAAVLPRTGFTGHTEPAERPELAAAVAAGTIGSRSATIITLALDRVRHHATEDITARMEHALTRTAAEHDTDFLTRIARQWTDAIDQDGTEPTENELRRRQGAFLRQPRRGLHHLEIFATTDQYESLLTVMNTATNPRTRPGTAEGNDADTDTTTTTGGGDVTGGHAVQRPARQPGRRGRRRGRPTRIWTADPAAAAPRRPRRRLQSSPRHRHPARRGRAPAPGHGHHRLPRPPGPPRTHHRPGTALPIPNRGHPPRLQQGGSAWRAGTGGHRPERRPRNDLRPATGHGCDSTSHADNNGFDGFESVTADHGCDSTIPGTGSFTFTGPVPAAIVRKIACDADIIPVLLGSQGRILDIGRTTRIFPPHIRKAITARDQGCAFPGCTIPAPWCEAHHITYWSHGGTTSTDNGTLLCSHHHHLIHKEQWTIHVKTGIPWFIPPPHIDPHQQPQRNNYFRLE